MSQTVKKLGKYDVDWQHFSLQDFLELRWRLLHDYDAVLPGGEYFGQVRCGDICYDIQIEWLETEGGEIAAKDSKAPELELFVTMSPFFPHEKEAVNAPYEELVPGMPYDTQRGASLVYARHAFLQMGYEDFQHLAEQDMAGKIAAFPRLQQEAAKMTGFWDRHDAILFRLRQEEEEKGEREDTEE